MVQLRSISFAFHDNGLRLYEQNTNISDGRSLTLIVYWRLPSVTVTE